MSEPTLFDQQPIDKIQERFELWIEANPRVIPTLVQMARRAVANGFRQYGMKALVEVLRWRWDVETERPSEEPFKLPNEYTSRLSRRIMETYPEFAGTETEPPFFVTHKLDSE